jgi:hypothetical protein
MESQGVERPTMEKERPRKGKAGPRQEPEKGRQGIAMAKGKKVQGKSKIR